jgi:hypothetical protein
VGWLAAADGGAVIAHAGAVKERAAPKQQGMKVLCLPVAPVVLVLLQLGRVAAAAAARLPWLLK